MSTAGPEAGGKDPCRSGRWFRRTVLTSLATSALLAVLYLAEDWRGHRTWQAYKQELNAKGHLLKLPDTNAPSVPDDQNFLKAPLVEAWFTTDSGPEGPKPTPGIIEIPRSEDVNLLGAWSEMKPTRLREWREVFRRPSTNPVAFLPPRSADSETNHDDILPFIVMDDVLLKDAIKNLARQEGLTVVSHPGTDELTGLVALRGQRVSIRFEQVTARQALEAMLANYGLRMIENKANRTIRIARALPRPSEVPDEMVDLATAPLPPAADEVVQVIKTDEVPVCDVIRNIARQAGIKFIFAPEVPESFAEAHCSLSWSNVTLRRALWQVLRDHGLAMKRAPSSEVFRVFRLQPGQQPRQDGSAVDVLKSFELFEAEFRALYAACKRPYCYRGPVERHWFGDPKPVPSFSAYRKVSQALALHASAHLALGHSDVAMRDATALFRIIESLADTRTLIDAMTGVAISGWYGQVIWEGLASQRWNDEQLKTLEQQLASIDLLARCDVGLQAEQTALNDWLEQSSRWQLARGIGDIFDVSAGFGDPRTTALPMQVFILTCPRGWLRQNQLRVARRFEQHVSLLDASRQRVHPDREPALIKAAATTWQELTPYNCVARKIGPYYTKAVQATARIQNGLNMARIACALERYRLAHGEFPETLAALPPEFIDRLPHDLINGLPLNYQRAENGQFVLYSEGWNVPRDATKPDSAETPPVRWIWRYPAKEPAASDSRLMAPRVETTR